jgi:hypothetical protein
MQESVPIYRKIRHNFFIFFEKKTKLHHENSKRIITVVLVGTSFKHGQNSNNKSWVSAEDNKILSAGTLFARNHESAVV